MDALPKDFSFDAYPNLRLYIQQLILLSELQSEQLQEEIKSLTRQMTEGLIKTEQDHKLVEVLDHYRLLKKLFKLELGREEFRELQSQKISPMKIAATLELNSSKLSSITALFGVATRFYEGAIKREDFMMQRAREIMAERKTDKAVIITGGFHTDGFKEKITASGSSYIGITPAIGEVSADSQKNYLTALLGSGAISHSHIAPEMITQPSFFQAVSPRFWRRELAVRLVRIRDIVRQAVASFGNRVTENKAEFDAGFQRLIASAVGISAQLQPAPVVARPVLDGRSEVRGQGIFTGSYSAEMDPKNRITVPSKFRKQVEEGSQLIAVPEKDVKELRVYPFKTWQKVTAANRPQDAGEARKYDDETHRNASLLKLDVQGRVSLSEPLRLGWLDSAIKSLEIVGANDSFLIKPRSEIRESNVEERDVQRSLARKDSPTAQAVRARLEQEIESVIARLAKHWKLQAAIGDGLSLGKYWWTNYEDEFSWGDSWGIALANLSFRTLHDTVARLKQSTPSVNYDRLRGTKQFQELATTLKNMDALLIQNIIDRKYPYPERFVQSRAEVRAFGRLSVASEKSVQSEEAYTKYKKKLTRAFEAADQANKRFRDRVINEQAKLNIAESLAPSISSANKGRGRSEMRSTPQRAGGQAKILIVDDDESVRRALARVFESEGYEVVTAGSVEAAFAEYQKAQEAGEPFALGVFDWNLQNKGDGAGLARRVKNLLIIFSSSDVFNDGELNTARIETALERLRRLKVDFLIVPKPADIDELLSAAGTIVGKQRKKSASDADSRPRSEVRKEKITIDLEKRAFEESDRMTLAGLLKRILLEDEKIPEEELMEFGVVKLELPDSGEIPEKHRGKHYSFDPLPLDKLDPLLEKRIGFNDGRLFRRVVLERNKISKSVSVSAPDSPVETDLKLIVPAPSVVSSEQTASLEESGEVRRLVNDKRKIIVVATVKRTLPKIPPKKASKAWLWVTLTVAGLVIGGIVLAVTKPWEKKSSVAPAVMPAGEASRPNKVGRSEMRQRKQIFSLTQEELKGVKGMTVFAYLRSRGIEEASLQNSILTVRSRFSDQIYRVTIGNKNEVTPSWAVDGLLAQLGIRDISDVVFIKGHSSLIPEAKIVPASTRSELRSSSIQGIKNLEDFEEGFGGKSIVEALEKAGKSVVFLSKEKTPDYIAEEIQGHQVIYFEPELDTEKYDYGASEEALITFARDRIGPALAQVRGKEKEEGAGRQRKIFILRGMVDPGTSRLIYDTIKWNAHPAADDDLDFDLVFQPDFSFLDARSGALKEPTAVFGLMMEKSQEFQNKTKEILNRVFKELYQDTPIRYMNIRSAEMAKESLLIYLGAKLAHFDDIAELSRAYGADLSAAAFGAGLDKRIRTLFTNPSLGFGGKLFVFLNWLYAQRLYKAVVELEGQAHQKPDERKQEIERKLQASVERLERGEEIASILKELPVPLHLLFVLKTIMKVNRQNILDFYNSITREYERLYGHGSLQGKKVALLSVGYGSKNEKIAASPALLLIKRLVIDEGINEFYIADPAAQKALQKWVDDEARENPRFKAVHFDVSQDIYEAAQKADLTIIPTASNPALKNINIEKLGKALNGKPVFDGMNLFGLRADGTSRYKLEDVRKQFINLLGVGRLPMGPALDSKSGYRLSDSEVIETVAAYEQAIRVRGEHPSQQSASLQKSVAVIGGGYVGLVTAANLAALGHKVHVVDIKAKQKEIDALNSPATAVPIYEPGLRAMIIDGKAKGLITFSTELETAVKDASIVYLAVGTPSQDAGEVDLKFILKAAADVGNVIKQYGGRKAIVIKSTVTPDTFRKMNDVLKGQGLTLGEDYVPVSNPEFLREGQAIEDVTKPDRTVLGFYAALTPEHRARAEKEILELWYPLMLKHPHTVLLTDTASSTIVKYLANSFLAISITFSNIFAEAAEWDGADFQEVRIPLATDERIGKNAFLASGIGYGGSCFPKDVLALNFSSKDSTGHALPLIDIATGFNDYFKKAIVARTVEKVAAFPKAARPLEGETVIMLGMAFKADTDDMREASSAYVLHELLMNGAKQVRLHDPILSMPNVPAPEVIKDHFLDYLFKTFQKDEDFQSAYQRHKKISLATEEKAPTEVEYFKKQYFPEKYLKEGRVVFEPELEKLGQADIVFLVTEWSQYKDIDLSKFKQSDKKLWVVDGRNLFYNRRNEIIKFADYMGVGTTLTISRSELRQRENWAEEFFRVNAENGGGSEQGVRSVTGKIMNGIIPLLAYAFKTKDAILAKLVPSTQSTQSVTISSQPQDLFGKIRLKLLKVALGVKTFQANDVLVLDPETAFKRGLIYIIRNVFGNIPVVVLTEDPADRGFLKKINDQLRQAKRPTILLAANLDEARKILDADQEAVPVRGSRNLKAMIFAGANNPQATFLAEQLKDNITTIDPKMFKNFLNLAGLGVSQMVERMQAEYLATARSA